MSLVADICVREEVRDMIPVDSAIVMVVRCKEEERNAKQEDIIL